MSTSSSPDCLYDASSAMWKVNREAFVLIGGAAATVLQAAHPVVAKGVTHHSDFKTAPFGRLRRTLDAAYTVAFGTLAEVERLEGHMIAMHRRVQGEGYSGLDPEAQYWVLATLIMTSIEGYTRIYGPLTSGDKEAFYQDMRRFGRCFGLSDSYGPTTWSTFADYYQAMLARPDLGTSTESQDVAQAIVYPRRPLHIRLLAILGRFLVIEILPAHIRTRLGLTSTRWTRWQWNLTQILCRSLVPRLPKRLRWVPRYFKAQARLAG